MAWAEKYADISIGGTGGAGTVGDPWKSLADIAANATAGDRVNVKGTENITTHTTITIAGTATAPVWWRGYTTTIGDGGFFNVTYTGNGADLTINGANNIVEGLHFYAGGSANQHLCNISGANSIAYRCKIEMTFAGTNPAMPTMFRCYLKFSERGQLNAAGGNAFDVTWDHCFFEHTASASIPAARCASADCFGRSVYITNCIFAGQGDTADGLFLNRIDSGHGAIVSGNRFYNFINGIEVDEQPANDAEAVFICNNVFDTMGGHGIKMNNIDLGFVSIFNNFYRNCVSGFTDYPTEAEVFGNNVALTADPFVDASSLDFNINNIAGGGTVLRGETYDVDPTA